MISSRIHRRIFSLSIEWDICDLLYVSLHIMEEQHKASKIELVKILQLPLLYFIFPVFAVEARPIELFVDGTTQLFNDGNQQKDHSSV